MIRALTAIAIVLALPASAQVSQGPKNVPEFEPAFENQTRAPEISGTVAFRVVPVAEGQRQGVVAHGFDVANGYVLLAGLQDFLSRPVASHLRRGRVDAQQLTAELQSGSVRIAQLQEA